MKKIISILPLLIFTIMASSQLRRNDVKTTPTQPSTKPAVVAVKPVEKPVLSRATAVIKKTIGSGYVKMKLRLPFTTEAKEYIVKKEGHYYILNGDIIVANDFASQPGYSVIYSYSTDSKSEKWPNAEIPVVIDKSIFDQNMQEMVVSALNAMNSQLELNIIEHTTQEDYVRISFSSEIKGAGQSLVGRDGGEQPLFLSRTANKTTIWHEMLHAAGIWHEQSRSDRGNYVHIRDENIKDDLENNFEIEPGDTHGNYDYCSIMHYFSKAFSKNDQPTIECLSKGVSVSCPPCMDVNNKSFSTDDIKGLDEFYNEVSRFASHYKFVTPQSSWRYCKKCHSMFFNGYQEKGRCPAKGEHEAAGYNFLFPHDVPGTKTAQPSWRFCSKCYMVFYDGYPQKGKCAGSGGHTAEGFNFILPHDVPGTATAQSSWRYCDKCFTMFFDGYPQKGSCAGGGGHSAAGYMFVLPHN